MPTIDEKIKAQAQLVDAKLSRLPELPLHNVQHVVRQCLQAFANEVQKVLEGGAATDGFLSGWTKLFAEFADAIQIMKPMFVYTDPSDMAAPEIINLDDDSDDGSSRRSSVPPPPSLKRGMEDSFSPQPKRQNVDMHPRQGTPQTFVRPKNEEGSPGQPRRLKGKQPTVFDKYHGAGKKFMTIAEVRGIIAKHRRPGNPAIITDAAREEICLASIWPWNGPLATLSDATFQGLKSAILAVLERKMGHFKQTDLFRKSRRKILDFLAQHQAEQRQALDAFYELENYKAFTLNNVAFERFQTEELKILQAKRRERRVQCYVQKQAFLSKKPLTEASRAHLEKSATDDELGPDPFRLEIETAAYVRGYYKTAGYRFAENLCQSIQGNLLRKIQTEIPFLLENFHGLNSGDGNWLLPPDSSSLMLTRHRGNEVP